MDNFNYCGSCVHWHALEEQPYKLRLGECKKIAVGTRYPCDGDAYFFSGKTFEDEVYDDEFGCFEEVK